MDDRNEIKKIREKILKNQEFRALRVLFWHLNLVFSMIDRTFTTYVCMRKIVFIFVLSYDHTFFFCTGWSWFDVQVSGLLGIWASGLLGIWASRHLGIWPPGHVGFWQCCICFARSIGQSKAKKIALLCSASTIFRSLKKQTRFFGIF